MDTPSPANPRPVLKPLVILAVMAVVLAGVVWFASGSDDAAEGPALPEDPAAFVESYLLELRASDAEAAYAHLSLARDRSYDDPRNAALSNEVVAASNYIAQLEDVEVGEPSETPSGAHIVPASFTIGGEPFFRTFEVMQDDDGKNQLHDAILTLTADPPSAFRASGIRVNGASATTVSTRLFPGAYVLDTDSEFLGFGGSNGPAMPVVVVDDADVLEGMLPLPTDDAVDQARDLIRESWRSCLESGEYEVECGMTPLLQSIGEPGDAEGHRIGDMLPGSVERTLTPAASAAVESAIESADFVQRADDVGTWELELPIDVQRDLTVSVELEGDGAAEGDDTQSRRVEVPEISPLRIPGIDFSRVILKPKWIFR